MRRKKMKVENKETKTKEKNKNTNIMKSKFALKIPIHQYGEDYKYHQELHLEN